MEWATYGSVCAACEREDGPETQGSDTVVREWSTELVTLDHEGEHVCEVTTTSSVITVHQSQAAHWEK